MSLSSNVIKVGFTKLNWSSGVTVHLNCRTNEVVFDGGKTCEVIKEEPTKITRTVTKVVTKIVSPYDENQKKILKKALGSYQYVIEEKVEKLRRKAFKVEERTYEIIDMIDALGI